MFLTEHGRTLERCVIHLRAAPKPAGPNGEIKVEFVRQGIDEEITAVLILQTQSCCISDVNMQQGCMDEN